MELLAFVIVSGITGATVCFVTYVREKSKAKIQLAHEQRMMMTDRNYVALRAIELKNERKILGDGK